MAAVGAQYDFDSPMSDFTTSDKNSPLTLLGYKSSKLDVLMRDLFVKNCVFVDDLNQLLANEIPGSPTFLILSELRRLHMCLPQKVSGLEKWISSVAPVYERYAHAYTVDPESPASVSFLKGRPLSYLTQLTKRVVTIEFELLANVGSGRLQEMVHYARTKIRDNMDNIHHTTYDFSHVRDFTTLQYTTNGWFDAAQITQSANFDFELHHSLGSIAKTPVQLLIVEEEESLSLAICSLSRSPSLIFPPFRSTDLVFDRENSTANCLILVCRCCCISQKKIFLSSPVDSKVKAWNWKLSRLFCLSPSEGSRISVDSVRSGLGIEFDASMSFSSSDTREKIPSSVFSSLSSLKRLSVPLTPSLSEQLKDYLSPDGLSKDDSLALGLHDFLSLSKERNKENWSNANGTILNLEQSKEFSSSTISSTFSHISSVSDASLQLSENSSPSFAESLATPLTSMCPALTSTAPLSIKPRQKDLEISQKLAMAMSSRDVYSSQGRARKGLSMIVNSSDSLPRPRTGYLPRSRSDNDAVLSTVMEQSPTLEQEDDKGHSQDKKGPVNQHSLNSTETRVMTVISRKESECSTVTPSKIEPSQPASDQPRHRLRVKTLVRKIRRLVSRERITFELINDGPSGEVPINHGGEHTSDQNRVVHNTMENSEPEHAVYKVPDVPLPVPAETAPVVRRRRANSMTPSIASCEGSSNSTMELGVKSSISMKSLQKFNHSNSSSVSSSTPSLKFPVFTGTGIVSIWKNGSWSIHESCSGEVLIELFSSGQLVLGGTSVKLHMACEIRRSTVQDVEVNCKDKILMLRFSSISDVEQFVTCFYSWKSNKTPIPTAPTHKLRKSVSTPSLISRKTSLSSLSSALGPHISNSKSMPNPTQPRYLLPPILSDKNKAECGSPVDSALAERCASPSMDIQKKYFQTADCLLLLNNLRCRYSKRQSTENWPSDKKLVRMSIYSQPGSDSKEILFRNIGSENTVTKVTQVGKGMSERQGTVDVIVTKGTEQYLIECKGEKEANYVTELLEGK